MLWGQKNWLFSKVRCSYKLVQPLWKTVWRFLKKTKNRTTIWSSNPTPGYLAQENRTANSKECIHSSTIYNSQDGQPTPVFLPGKSQGWRSRTGCSPYRHKESDTTERLHSLSRLEATYVSINRGMDKDVVYTVECCSCSYVLTKSCLTYYDPMDCSLAGSSVYGMSQARILEWVVISSPGDLPNPGIEPTSPALASGCSMTEQLRKLVMEYYSDIKRMKVYHWQQRG